MLVTQSCLTLCDPMDCSPPGSSVRGILQATTLEWVVIPSPGDLPDPRIEPGSPALQADSLPSEPPGKPLRRYLRLNEVIGWSPDLIGLVSLLKRGRDTRDLSVYTHTEKSMCEDTVSSQGQRPHQKPTLPAPRS